MDYQIYNEDCIKGMEKLADGSVDAIICDLPYGTTDCSWDKVLPLDKIWEQFNRVTKQNGAIILFSQLPFAVDLINANRKMFRYEWIWEKSTACGFLNANKMPLRAHENILVFYRRLPTYNPQWQEGKPYEKKHHNMSKSEVYQKFKHIGKVQDGQHYYPRDVVRVASISTGKKSEPRCHPTQKPIALLEMLVKTYTNEGEIILDATMGSGSTGVACINTRRRFIGFELEEKYFKVTQQRLQEAQARRGLF